MQSLVRPVVGIALFVGVLSPFVLPRRALPLSTKKIVEMHTPAITTYLPSQVTPVQDIRPQVLQRGVQLDGRLHAAPSQHMAINGNPFESAWRAPTIGGINLAVGTYEVPETDIALPAEGFSWVVGRTHNARQVSSGGSHRNSDGVNGLNWFQSSQPVIVLYDSATDANDVIFLVYGAQSFAEYKRVETPGLGVGTTYKGTNGAAGVFVFTDGGSGPDSYELTDQRGTKFTFIGFDAQAYSAAGQLWKIQDLDGNVAYVGDSSSVAAAIDQANGYLKGFDSSGRMLKAYDSSDRRYSYTYTSLDSVTRLTQVKAETKTGGTWSSSPTGVATVMTVDYGYYTSESYGDPGDLKTVTLTTPLTDSGVSLTQKKYYRYWEGTYNSSTNPGYPHALQYVVDFEGVRKFDWSDSTFDDDFLTASEGSLRPYASAYFEYNSSHQIREAWFNGECGCSGANNGTYEFEYESNPWFIEFATNAYDTEWNTRTVVQRPDTSYLTQYWDEVGQPLSQVITDADPDNTSPVPARWVTRVDRDSSGFVSTIYTPANCTGYSHNPGEEDPMFSNSTSVGLVWEYSRNTSGAMTGFANARKYRVGTSGTLYYASESSYTQNDLPLGSGAGSTEVIRPGINGMTRYPQLTSSSEDDFEDVHDVTFDGTVKLWIVSDETTYTAVSDENNGSDAALSETRYFRIDGTGSFERKRDGVVMYAEYTNGLPTELIVDADTDLIDDFDVGVPTALSSPSGFHRITTNTYDAQGRLDLVTAPDGRKTKHYYSKLADGRLVALTYADYEATPKFYGPVEYTVTNQAGNAEVRATVALTSNESTTALTGHVDESDADPITAMDLGTVARLSTSIYNESGGTMQESRLYFVIPSSGAGTDGTNYDPTLYGYDDNGRRVRTKEPHGTITRSVHDKLGRVTGRWMGTNDHSFAGGEGSGTDNMVQTEALQYDGNDDDGNGYLTQRTLYVQSGSTGQRVTTYAHDAHGRVVLQTNPTAPHQLNKYDNEGRNVATALLSTTSGVAAGTDDPTQATLTPRRALTESYFDEVGQLWKSVRHNIDATDGSDDDTLLHLYWRDAGGRVLKEDGPQLTKTTYDRIGRVTRSFVLIEDDDSAYSDVDDLSGDYVAEEEQTVYESTTSDDVLMSVRLDRKHNDGDGTSPTTGPLDTNADTDRMLLTSSNLKGRAQIRCSWYDRFGRMTDQVEYGDYGGATFDRDPLSVPSRSDTALVTSYAYNADGELLTTTDPRGLLKRTEYDDAGRMAKRIRNYSVSVNSGNPANPDDNQTVKYEFVDGLRTKIIADMPSGEDDQETVYIYGTSSGTPSAMTVSTGHLLRAVKYPDTSNSGTTSAAIASDSSDVVSYAYNAQGQETYTKDQAGNVCETDYDTSGHQLHLRVTTIASGFEGAVRRQSRTYDSLGRPSLVSQYDNATVGSGSVTDEVSYIYDGWDGITNYKQDKDSAVGGSGLYEMAYTYVKNEGNRNTIRRTTMTLPGGKVITLEYDGMSRVSRLKDGATTLAKYEYLGASRVVGTTYSEPNIARTEYSTFSISYSGYLDSFNRVLSSTWWSLAPNPDKVFYDADISYDRNSNITWVEDNVHPGFDVKYTMDDLDRLIDAEEGTRSSGSIASRTRHQTWLQSGTSQLSHTGNWARSKMDLDGDDNWNETEEYDDTRTHNKVNELTARDTDTSGSNNYTLAYDAAGDLTDDGETYKYEYDAFYRLRKVKSQSSTLLAEYRYNGMGHMIGVHEDTDADGDADASDVWFYPAYDEGWREVARYREGDTSPKEQFVNATAGLDGYGESSYINDVVCRNRDNTSGWLAASDGTLEERYYLCPNWRGDVSAMVSSGRQLHEMDKYSAYGIPFGLPGGDTNSDGENDSSDATQIQAWIDLPAYDVRGDVDLDGDIDSTDKTLVQAAPISGCALGWDSIGGSEVGNRTGWAGAQHLPGLGIVQSRYRSYGSGRWLQRDPLVYVDGPNQYQALVSRPIVMSDPYGTTACADLCEGHAGQRIALCILQNDVYVYFVCDCPNGDDEEECHGNTEKWGAPRGGGPRMTACVPHTGSPEEDDEYWAANRIIMDRVARDMLSDFSCHGGCPDDDQTCTPDITGSGDCDTERIERPTIYIPVSLPRGNLLPRAAGVPLFCLTCRVDVILATARCRCQ